MKLGLVEGEMVGWRDERVGCGEGAIEGDWEGKDGAKEGTAVGKLVESVG